MFDFTLLTVIINVIKIKRKLRNPPSRYFKDAIIVWDCKFETVKVD